MVAFDPQVDEGTDVELDFHVDVEVEVGFVVP